MNEEFLVNGVVVITRSGLEELNICTFNVSDELLGTIAKEIFDDMLERHSIREVKNFMKNKECNKYEPIGISYICSLENISGHYGLKFYENMSDEEIEELLILKGEL